MGEEERTCIICLDSPQQGNPLFLLHCGCRTAWFHEACETNWIEHIQPVDFPPKCPTCRRNIQFCLKHSFVYQNGVNQRYFWWICSLFLCELFMCSVFSFDGYHQAWYLPSQSILIVSLPLIVQSQHDILYFLHHLRYRYLAFSLSWFIHVFKYKKLLSLYPDDTLNLLILIGFVHVIGLVLQEVHNYYSHDHYRIDPFISFVTGYTLIHSETLHFRQSPPIPLKGNKLPSRRSSRIRNQSI
jgi:hypothetical protein